MESVGFTLTTLGRTTVRPSTVFFCLFFLWGLSVRADRPVRWRLRPAPVCGSADAGAALSLRRPTAGRRCRRRRHPPLRHCVGHGFKKRKTKQNRRQLETPPTAPRSTLAVTPASRFDDDARRRPLESATRNSQRTRRGSRCSWQEKRWPASPFIWKRKTDSNSNNNNKKNKTKKNGAKTNENKIGRQLRPERLSRVPEPSHDAVGSLYYGQYWFQCGQTAFYGVQTKFNRVFLWLLPSFIALYGIMLLLHTLDRYYGRYRVLIGFNWFQRGHTTFYLVLPGFSLIVIKFHRSLWNRTAITRYTW